MPYTNLKFGNHGGGALHDNAHQFSLSVPDAASERYRHRDVEEEQDDDGDHEEDERRQLIYRVTLREKGNGRYTCM